MSPGRGWVPQRRFRLFRCLKLAPAERCGHVTERRQSAPACLRVPAPNARRAEERRLRPAGRAGKAAPGLEGAAGGTRGRAGGVQQPARSASDRPASVVHFLPGQRTPLPPVSYPLGCRWLPRPAQPSRLRGLRPGFLPTGLRLLAFAPPRPGRWPPPPRPQPGGVPTILYSLPSTYFRKEGKTQWPTRASLPWAQRLMEKEHRMR